MNDALTLLRKRTRRLNDHAVSSGRDYVLCWLQQALRAQDNPIIDAAIAAGNKHGLPVVVNHGLDNRYPHASHRLHRFILQASQSLEAGVAERGLRFCRYVRRPDKLEKGLVYRLCDRAALLVTDDMPTFVAKRQAERVAARVSVPVLAVDASCLVPMNCFDAHYGITKAFRAAHTPQRETHLEVDLQQKSAHGRYEGALCFESDGLDDLDGVIGRTHVDMTLPPVAFDGSRTAALEQVDFAIKRVVDRYRWQRNNPALPNSTSKLSPYMHFGVLSPREVVLRVKESDVNKAAHWKFFDELLTWREYYHHVARWEADPTQFSSLPKWARDSLLAHAADERLTVYSEDQLLHGETTDETWNAAQKQFLLDGWMHNNLRMYWVKQFIKWRPHPEDAWTMARRFNDSLSLDGRDPATYGSIQWGFGRAKKAYRENPIYGWVAPKTDRTLRKRDGAAEWLAEQAARPVPFRLEIST